MDLSAVRSRLAADLSATGLRVSVDPRNVNAPCVLVGPITQVETGGTSAWSVEVPVYLISTAPGDAKSVDWLAAHVTDVINALPEVNEALLGTYETSQGDLPCFQMTATYVEQE